MHGKFWRPTNAKMPRAEKTTANKRGEVDTHKFGRPKQ
jgi:hypothetical protein